jgi:hypothetical protein
MQQDLAVDCLVQLVHDFNFQGKSGAMQASVCQVTHYMTLPRLLTRTVSHTLQPAVASGAKLVGADQLDRCNVVVLRHKQQPIYSIASSLPGTLVVNIDWMLAVSASQSVPELREVAPGSSQASCSCSCATSHHRIVPLAPAHRHSCRCRAHSPPALNRTMPVSAQAATQHAQPDASSPPALLHSLLGPVWPDVGLPLTSCPCPHLCLLPHRSTSRCPAPSSLACHSTSRSSACLTSRCVGV